MLIVIQLKHGEIFKKAEVTQHQHLTEFHLDQQNSVIPGCLAFKVFNDVQKKLISVMGESNELSYQQVPSKVQVDFVATHDDALEGNHWVGTANAGNIDSQC